MRNPFRRKRTPEAARRRITAVLLTFDEILATSIFSNASPPASPAARRTPSPKSAALVERELEQIAQQMKDARESLAECNALERDWTGRAEEAGKFGQTNLAATAHLRARMAGQEAERWSIAVQELERLLAYAHDSLAELRGASPSR